MRLAAGGSYTLATADANVAAGHTLTVDATALTTANTLSFNGAAETDGGFAFRFTGGLNATDSLNGGTGNTSTLDLNGDYSAGLTLNGSHIANIPHITVEAGHNYNLTWTGAAPTSTFTVDGSALGASNTLALNFSAATGITAATFIGGAGNDTLTGGNGPTAFNLTQGGNDTATGGSGADTFALGTTFTNADTLSGGAGNDTVSLSGPYSLTFGAAALTSIEALQLAAGANYTLATVDANVAAGATLAIDASALGAGNVLTFDGSAETDGSFAITGGAGNDSVTGGAGADTFDMSKGGNDTVHAGDGNDTISFGSALTSADTIDGGAGSDTVALSGTNSITLAATTLTSVEALRLAAGGSYTLTTVDANVAAGQTLTVDATALAAANTLAFNGAAETDGSFAFRFGAGLNATDTLNGGASGASTLDLNGDYSAGLTLSGSHITNIPRISVEAGHNYNLTWTGAAPATFTVDGSALGASNTLAFNISGATGITAATLIGGAGNDTLTGGSAPTNFDLSHGGNDTATGGSGGDTFTMGAALTASDVLNGGAGNDVVVLNGDYGTTLKTGFNMNNFAGIETLLLTAGHSYSIVDAHDNFTTAFTVDGSTLGTGDSLNFVSDSSAGIFDLIGGAGNDNLTLGESGTIDLTLGGEDTATAAAGQTIFMGSTLDAGDKLNGGGFANVDLNGDYTGANAITLTSANLIDMGNMVLEDGHSYDITYTSAAAPGPAFVLDASALSAAQTLTASFANVTAATMITGGAGNDVITGSHDVDVDLTNGGNDTVAGAGTVYMGTTFDGNDALTNVTMLVLDGTYSGAHALNITSAANLSTAELVLQGDFNYNITVASAQIVSTLTSDGNGSVTFDGSAETTNGYTVHADSDSSATLTGGGGNDLLESSDTDTVVLHGGGGDDMLSSVINGTSSGNDVFDGGAGNDTLTLIATGNTLGTTMSAHSMTSIENLDVFNDITLNDANLAAGQTMNVTVGGTNARFLAGTETDGHFNITYNVTGTQGQIDAGALSDTITMTGTDGGTFIAGDGGADTITLSTEHDFFIGFGFVSDSTGVNYDTVNNMNFHTGDEFYYDTGSSSNAITAINTAITHGALSTATFDTDLTADLASGLSAHHAVLFTPDSGTLAGQTFIIIDVNGQTGYQSGQDFVVDITGYSGTLSKVNFDFN
jgi:Ca2+-binding RTX toxin-like protein